MAYDENCIFCRIIAKMAPASVIYEDREVMAFLDIRPLNLGHTLVIPRAHFIDIFDIPQNLLSQVYVSSKIIAPAVRAATKADGISIIQQNGKAAGQDIFHFHVHVVPRFQGQKMPRFSDLQTVERPILDEIAEKIRKHL